MRERASPGPREISYPLPPSHNSDHLQSPLGAPLHRKPSCVRHSCASSLPIFAVPRESGRIYWTQRSTCQNLCRPVLAKVLTDQSSGEMQPKLGNRRCLGLRPLRCPMVERGEDKRMVEIGRASASEGGNAAGLAAAGVSAHATHREIASKDSDSTCCHAVRYIRTGHAAAVREQPPTLRLHSDQLPARLAAAGLGYRVPMVEVVGFVAWLGQPACALAHQEESMLTSSIWTTSASTRRMFRRSPIGASGASGASGQSEVQGGPRTAGLACALACDTFW